MMIVPLEEGTGTRIKIIEALLVGCKVLSTKKGIEGILIKKNDPIHIKEKNFINIYQKILIKIIKIKFQKDF